MPRPEKIEFVSNLTEKVRKCQSIVLADFCGLSVAQMSGLRNELRKEGVELKVIKNRLGRRALANANCESLDDILKGNTLWAFGIRDAAAPAKILIKFAKDNEKLVLKGGLLESRRIDKAGVTALASMPGRHELLGRMAFGLKQPATKMATVMQAGLLKVAHAMNALARKQEEGAPAA